MGEEEEGTGNLVDADNSVSDVVQGDLTISVHIQNVKGLLRLLRLQEVFQVFRQDVRPASAMPSDCLPTPTHHSVSVLRRRHNLNSWRHPILPSPRTYTLAAFSSPTCWSKTAPSPTLGDLKPSPTSFRPRIKSSCRNQHQPRSSILRGKVCNRQCRRRKCQAAQVEAGWDLLKEGLMFQKR